MTDFDELPPPVDDDDATAIRITGKALRLSPDGVRALAKATGRSMTELLTDDADEANRFQVIVFADLHRRFSRSGHMPDAATLWEMAGRADVILEPDDVPDPLDSESSTLSLPSVDIGE